MTKFMVKYVALIQGGVVKHNSSSGPGGNMVKQKAVANCVWMLVVKIKSIERIY